MVTKEYRWYVIKTKSRHELAVVDYLTKSGIDCFCPVKKETRIRTVGVFEIDVPIFSLYVFVKTSCKEYFDILNNPSVLHFVNTCGIPDSITIVVINGLKNIGFNGLKYEVSDNHFQKGEKVTIKSGYFAGHRGEIVRHNCKKKILIRISSFGYSILIGIENIDLNNYQ